MQNTDTLARTAALEKYRAENDVAERAGRLYEHITSQQKGLPEEYLGTFPIPGSECTIHVSNVDDDAYVFLNNVLVLHVGGGKTGDISFRVQAGHNRMEFVVGNGWGGDWSSTFEVRHRGVTVITARAWGHHTHGFGPHYPSRQIIDLNYGR